MGRILVLILLVVFAVWLVRRALRREAPPDRPPAPQVEGELVACAHCGVHLPRSEARSRAGALYCSEEHAARGRR